MNTNHVKCIDCRNLQGAWCHNARKAQLAGGWNNKAEISRTLSQMEQRCFGFAAKKATQ